MQHAPQPKRQSIARLSARSAPAQAGRRALAAARTHFLKASMIHPQFPNWGRAAPIQPGAQPNLIRIAKRRLPDYLGLQIASAP